jgi:hypothetical protein
MSRLNVENIRHPDAASDSLQLSDAGNITAPGNLILTGSLTANGLAYPTDGPLSNRNLIINGAMQVAQRGTSFTGLTSGNNYSADRFIFSLTSSGTATLTQSADAPVGFKNSFKIEFTAAAASPTEHKIEYRFEGQDVQQLEWGTANAKGITLSFYIKSNKTGNTQFALQNSANDRSYIAPFTIDAANTWERKTIYVPGDTSGTWLTGNDIGLRIRWGFYEASRQSSTVNAWQSGLYQTRSDSPINFADTIGNTFLLSGVQLEVGSVATPFEHRSYGQELSLCQRYFVSMNVTGFHWQAATTTRANGTIVLPSVMRSSPVLTCENVNRITNFGVIDYNGTYTFGGENTTPTHISASYTRSSGDSWTANIPLAINSTTQSTILTANSEL